MVHKIAITTNTAVRTLTGALAGLAALVGVGLLAAGPAAAYDGHGYGPRGGYERSRDWRPPPPAFHGYWGHRQWRRHHDGYGFRPPPPHYSGWR